MSDTVLNQINKLTDNNIHHYLSDIVRGIEKESLRVKLEGELALTPHAGVLGSALTHPHITTDYSEALLEFITPPNKSIDTTLNCLTDIHRFVYQCLSDEMLWSSSMPCVLPQEDAIPIAKYGLSNLGQLKHIYRRGLACRYGKPMQMISGIHYNFSLPESFWPEYQEIAKNQDQLDVFQSKCYFALLRNFRRYVWLLFYLFGASPAVCTSFFNKRRHELDYLNDYTLYSPYATTLRMSDLGYKNSQQAELNICYNTLNQYTASLDRAIRTEHPLYKKMGIKKNGQYIQLNANILQIENEYYSSVRPKRTSQSDRPIKALLNHGVEYIEVRCLDVNPFLPMGIDAEQIYFLDVFLLYCLFEESLPIDDNECMSIARNYQAAVNQGRDPAVEIEYKSKKIGLKDAAKHVMHGCQQIAQLLDSLEGSQQYTKAVQSQIEKIDDSNLTPSAKIISLLKNDKMTHGELTLQLSKQHAEYFKHYKLSSEQYHYFNKLAEDSLAKQSALETSDNSSFDDYLAQFMQS